MDGVTPGMTVGASTEALAGEGMIVTAGGIDTHICFDDSCTVHDQSVCDNEIKISFCTGCLNRLSHTVRNFCTF